MKWIFKEAVKMMLAVFLGLVYLWFLLSFTWSMDDMSVAEKVIGVTYTFLMLPIYEGVKAFGRWLIRCY